MSRPWFPARKGTPKPPPEIWDELTAAHDSGDLARIQIAEERTHAWAVENGYERPIGKPARADKAAQ
jgi:hypothetical protein